MHSHHVAQCDVVAAPFGESFIWILGESEIRHARESLLYAIVLVGREQLEGTQDAQNVGEIAANFVLAALTAIQSHQQRVHSAPARLQCQHATIFVIGVGHGLHQARRCAQPQKRKVQAIHALVLRKIWRNALIQESGRIDCRRRTNRRSLP